MVTCLYLNMVWITLTLVHLYKIGLFFWAAAKFGCVVLGAAAGEDVYQDSELSAVSYQTHRKLELSVLTDKVQTNTSLKS